MKLAKDWADPHRDEMYEAEQAFALSGVAADQRLHIHLTPGLQSGPVPFTCRYTPVR